MHWTVAILTAASLAVAVPAPTHAATDQGQRIAWAPCGPAECADVSVPLDWAAPRGRRITVAVTRLRAANPDRRVGVVFFNPGGPGSPARPFLRDYAEEVFPTDLLSHFDVVGVDPRGVGDSRPLITCPVPPNTVTVDQFPATRSAYDRLIAHNRRVAESCRTATGPLIDHVDTVSAARDFDAVRQALGERTVTWLGLSYGSLLGATHTRLHPDRVRAAALDGPVDHAVGSRRMATDEAGSTESTFTRFTRWCGETAECALHGQDISAEYRALMSDPVIAQRVGYGIYPALGAPASWPQVAEALRAAFTGDLSAFPTHADNAAYRVIACHDFPSDVRSFADLRSRISEVRALAPQTLGYVEAWDIQAGCLGWPIRPANPWRPEESATRAPVVVVAGKHDPATPYAWGVGLARQIHGSRLLAWDGDGHTAFFNDPTTRDAVVSFLITGQPR